MSKVAMLAHSSRMALDRRAEASTTLRKAVCVNGIISLRQKTATKRDGYGRRDSTARVDRRWHTPIDGGDGRPPPATQSQLRVATAGTPAAAPAPVEVAAAAPAPSETAAAAPAGKAAAVAPAPVEARAHVELAAPVEAAAAALAGEAAAAAPAPVEAAAAALAGEAAAGAPAPVEFTGGGRGAGQRDQPLLPLLPPPDVASMR